MSDSIKLDLSKTHLMGVLNVTPDSFSDGGRFTRFDLAVQHANEMLDAGVDIIDIGGESTRPGAKIVGVDEELDRTIPLIKEIRHFSPVPISIDTSKPEVMLASAEAGANLINDVWALRQPGALEAAAETGLSVCLMHMAGEPGTMQNDPHYDDVVAEVYEFLERRVDAATGAGIPLEKLMIDPGFGFGKNLQHNLLLLKSLSKFKQMNLPLLVGMSRKSMIGQITGKAVDQRLAGSLTLAVISAMSGADIVRVHDVTETRDALDIVGALNNH